MSSLAERVLGHARFRQRAVEPAVPVGTPHWKEVPDLDVKDHVHELVLAEGADDEALAHVVSELAATPLDRQRPLWHIHLVQGHRDGPFMLVRLHHAIGDGVSLVKLLLALTDYGDAAPRAPGLPMPKPQGLVAIGKTAVAHTAALAHLLALSPDAPTALRGELGPKKRAAWTRPFAVEELRTVARRAGAKLNDVLVSATAGAIRRYLHAREGLPHVAELRALVPVFMQGHGDGMGNHFGLVFVPLLVGLPDPLERLRATKVANDWVKASADAAVAIEVLAVMGAAGPQVENIGIDFFTRKASWMITNVPGPTGTLRLAGRPITDLLVWAPVAGHIGLGVSLLTYDGRVRVGLLSDALLVPDPERLARAFEDEIAALALD